MPGVDSDNWYAIFTSKGTPAADADRVSQALRRTLANAEVRAKLMASGAEPSAFGAAEFSYLPATTSCTGASAAGASSTLSSTLVSAAAAFFAGAFLAVFFAFGESDSASTSSMRAIGALSPLRGPSLVIRV